MIAVPTVCSPQTTVGSMSRDENRTWRDTDACWSSTTQKQKPHTEHTACIKYTYNIRHPASRIQQQTTSRSPQLPASSIQHPASSIQHASCDVACVRCVVRVRLYCYLESSIGCGHIDGRRLVGVLRGEHQLTYMHMHMHMHTDRSNINININTSSSTHGCQSNRWPCAALLLQLCARLFCVLCVYYDACSP